MEEEPNAGHVYSCSIGLSLKSNCACCWLTKTPVNEVTLFEQLTEDEKYILPLRTKLIVNDVVWVSLPHLSRFSQQRIFTCTFTWDGLIQPTRYTAAALGHRISIPDRLLFNATLSICQIKLHMSLVDK